MPEIVFETRTGERIPYPGLFYAIRKAMEPKAIQTIHHENFNLESGEGCWTSHLFLSPTGERWYSWQSWSKAWAWGGFDICWWRQQGSEWITTGLKVMIDTSHDGKAVAGEGGWKDWWNDAAWYRKASVHYPLCLTFSPPILHFLLCHLHTAQHSTAHTYTQTYKDTNTDLHTHFTNGFHAPLSSTKQSLLNSIYKISIIDS